MDMMDQISEIIRKHDDYSRIILSQAFPDGGTRHDVLTCPSSTIVGYRWGRANNP